MIPYRLLKMFPEDRKDQIMIICLYKEQKKMLERKLGTNYELHTVDSAQVIACLS